MSKKGRKRQLCIIVRTGRDVLQDTNVPTIYQGKLHSAALVTASVLVTHEHQTVGTGTCAHCQREYQKGIETDQFALAVVVIDFHRACICKHAQALDLALQRACIVGYPQRIDRLLGNVATEGERFEEGVFSLLYLHSNLAN